MKGNYPDSNPKPPGPKPSSYDWLKVEKEKNTCEDLARSSGGDCGTLYQEVLKNEGGGKFLDIV